MAFTNDNAAASSTIEQTTRFIDAKATIEDTVLSSYTKISELDDVHSIVQFLQRPALLYDTTITNIGGLIPVFPGPTGRAPLGQVALPVDILTHGRKLDKVANFEYFKATSCLKIMTNTPPTIAGRLWICFAPLQDFTRTGFRMRDKSLASLTSYPGVELDLQLNNSVTLDVPWLDDRECLSITGNTQELRNCHVHVYQLTPILASGPFKINLQIFGWFKDIELKGPTGRLPSVSPVINARFQIATEAPGPVTEISGMISKGASALKEVPVIGTVASAVSWVANLTNKVASIFGWSRPITGSSSEAFCNIPARGYAAIKASDNAVVLGFANDNSVSEVNQNFTQDIDEMQVEHICNRPAVVHSGVWVDNAISGAKLLEMPVGPQINDLTRTHQIGDDMLMDLSLFEYLATLFGYWRADIHLRVSFVKTAFHTGRVEIFYVPGIQIEDIDNIDSTNCYRQILDLSQQTEFEMVIPFMSQYVMANTGPFNEGAYRPYHAPGRFMIRALTPLMHPDNVSTSIGVVVWKWATNVAFSAPIDQGLKTYFYGVPAKLQIAVDNQATVENMVVFGGENSPDTTLNAVQTVCGEIIVNTRALTRAHRPNAFNVTNTTIVTASVGEDTGGYIAKIANIFAFYRGGLSYKFRPFGANFENTGYTMTALCRMFTPTDFLSLQPPTHITYHNLNPFHEVALPFYSNTRRALCNDSRMATDVFQSTSRHPGIRVTGTAPVYTTLVAGKDDFTCGMLIGCPVQYRKLV